MRILPVFWVLYFYAVFVSMCFMLSILDFGFEKLACEQSCDACGHCQQESQDPIHLKEVSWAKDQDQDNVSRLSQL